MGESVEPAVRLKVLQPEQNSICLVYNTVFVLAGPFTIQHWREPPKPTYYTNILLFHQTRLFFLEVRLPDILHVTFID